MTVAYPSVSTLNTLYASLCQKAQQDIAKSLNNPTDNTNYEKAVNSIFAWVEDYPKRASDIGGGVASTKEAMNGLRVQVILPDGVTLVDTYKSKVNHTLVNVNAISVFTPGLKLQYYINENQSSRSYNMGAFLSQSGVFTQMKYSNSTGVEQYYFAIRQGTSASEPLGNVVISMNAEAPPVV